MNGDVYKSMGKIKHQYNLQMSVINCIISKYKPTDKFGDEWKKEGTKESCINRFFFLIQSES